MSGQAGAPLGSPNIQVPQQGNPGLMDNRHLSPMPFNSMATSNVNNNVSQDMQQLGPTPPNSISSVNSSSTQDMFKAAPNTNASFGSGLASFIKSNPAQGSLGKPAGGK